jgi:RNA-directed DNA polymerase
MWRLTRACGWQRRAHLGDQHDRYTLLAKRSGGWRLLEVPHPYLMPLQRRLLDDLLDRIPPHEAACGYTRERSVVDHARTHAGQAVVLKFDLQDFFACVRASRVHALFETLGYADTVARALTALCTTATPEPVLRRMHEAGGLTWSQRQRLRDPHLPQGAPTSAALANLCAFRLDLRLDGLAHVLGARYTRYADDIVLSGGTHLKKAISRIDAWVGRIALEEGFTLNHRKTRCLTSARRQAVCSIVVNQHPNLPRPEFDRLKAILHQCVAQGPASQNREGRPHWREYLHGRVAWATQLNPSKAQRLKRLLDQIDWSR